MRKLLTAAATLAALAGLWAVQLPAAASGSDVTLTLPAGDTDGVSAEYANLDIAVDAGDVLSVDWTLSDGAQCSGGAPRAFVIVNAQVVNTWDDDFGDPGDVGDCDGTAEVALPNAGVVTHAGLVYDNSVPGTVTFTGLQVGGTPIPESVEPTVPTTVPDGTTTTTAPGTGPAGTPASVTPAPVAGPATPVVANPSFTG